MPTSTPIPVTPATRMRIATMYTGAGAMDYGYVRARNDVYDDANACREREKAQTPLTTDGRLARVCVYAAAALRSEGIINTSPRECSRRACVRAYTARAAGSWN